MVDQVEIHRMAWSEEVDERKKAAEQLSEKFVDLHDKKQAWNDLIKLTSDINIVVRRGAAYALRGAFSFAPDKKQACDDLIRLACDTDSFVRMNTAYVLGSAFVNVADRKKVWDDLIRLTCDTDSRVRRRASSALGNAFEHVPDKEQAWEDLHRLTSHNDSYVRCGAADALGSAFSHIPDKEQAWDDLIMLTWDTDSDVRRRAADTFGSAFEHVPDKKRAWENLHRLTSDKDSDVRMTANHSSGKVFIHWAGEAESEDVFREEMEIALGFFENASKDATFFNPAKFCLPFYRSFYTLTFKKEDAEIEVEKYLKEAKSAVQGSKSKERLLEAVENLGNALNETQKAHDFNDVKSDLNAYRLYCDRACELLDTIEDKAPDASSLIRRGLPIIDERIKGILSEIQGKAKALCKKVRDTEYKEIGQQLSNVGQELSKAIDPIRLEKEVSHMLIPLSAMCKKMPDEDRGEACEILTKINDERNVEDKLTLISMFLSKISTQMDQKIVYVNVEKSKNVQVSIGRDNYQVQI